MGQYSRLNKTGSVNHLNKYYHLLTFKRPELAHHMEKEKKT